MALAVLISLGQSDSAPSYALLTTEGTELELDIAPLTVNLVPLSGFAIALRDQTKSPVLLILSGISGQAAQPIRINVFLNKPNADRQASTNDPSNIGFIQLMPVRGVVRPFNFAFDMSQPLNLDNQNSLAITLVPVVGSEEAPRGLSLHIAHIFIGRQL